LSNQSESIRANATQAKRSLTGKEVDTILRWLASVNFFLDARQWADMARGFILNDVYMFGHMPLILECEECSAGNDGYPVPTGNMFYLKLNYQTGLYEEVPELYVPMQNPESRRMQELLAEGAPIEDRYDQYMKEQLLKAKEQASTQSSEA